MIVLGVAGVILVVWCVIVAVAMAARPPSIGQFEPRAAIDSDLVASVPILDLQRGAQAMPGVRVVNATDSALLLSVAPRLGSLDRGTGEWVLITRGTDWYQIGIRAKTALNLTVYSEAVVEFERELRMVLRRQGIVKFDFRESAASPRLRGSEPAHPTVMPPIEPPTESFPPAMPPPPSSPAAHRDAPASPPSSSPADQWWNS